MTQQETDMKYMREALEEARRACREEEVPIGAVVVCGDRIVGRGHNLTEKLADVTAHAEMQAITAAANTLGGKYLEECTLYVTLEPCLMCAGAIAWSQMRRVVYAAGDEKRGYSKFTTASPFHPKTEVCPGILAQEAAQLMSDFFKRKR